MSCFEYNTTSKIEVNYKTNMYIDDNKFDY
jgi:hypothetical protein